MKRSFLQKAKASVQESVGPESYLVQAVRSLDDLDETNALLYQRLEEWFKIHFPAFPFMGEEAAYYVAHLNDEDALVKKWPQEKVTHLREKMEHGFGAELKGEDLTAIQRLARQIEDGLETRKDLEEYVRSVANKTMPNACVLVDGLLAARLLSVIGSLEKLALFPASTLQVLGAEKALFKHLRKGTLPPKHGLIFQSPYVNGVPFDKRGKAARASPGKLAIALKADRYTKHAIGEKLKSDLEKRMEQIKALPTRDIKQIDYRDFAQKRFERRGPPRGDFRGPRREGGFGPRRDDGFRGPPREGGFRGPRRDGDFTRGPRRFDDRPPRSDDRPRFNDRPNFNDRPPRSEDRPRFNDRPLRSDDRPRFGDRKPSGGFERPKPRFDSRESGNRDGGQGRPFKKPFRKGPRR